MLLVYPFCHLLLFSIILSAVLSPSAAADIALLRLRIQGLADGERVALGNVF